MLVCGLVLLVWLMFNCWCSCGFGLSVVWFLDCSCLGCVDSLRFVIWDFAGSFDGLEVCGLVAIVLAVL